MLTDPTPERVAELLELGRMDGLCFMELERHAGLREGALERAVSESWQRQRAEIGRLRGLMRDDAVYVLDRVIDRLRAALPAEGAANEAEGVCIHVRELRTELGLSDGD